MRARVVGLCTHGCLWAGAEQLNRQKRRDSSDLLERGDPHDGVPAAASYAVPMVAQLKCHEDSMIHR